MRLGQVKAGDRVAVIGVGGIGVNAIQAAALAGAEVTGVDVNPAKEAVARQFGAEAFLRAERGVSSREGAAALSAAGPFDIVMECSGAPAAVEAAIHGVKRGGRVVLIGMTGPGATATVSLDAVLGGREIVSTMNGGARPEVDYSRLIALAKERKLDIAGQITRRWPLAEVEAAIAALEAGEVTRAILDHTA
jgi:S-(hydroxymethyl)glutathione dehydrogenase / alcohol dehydrogenase